MASGRASSRCCPPLTSTPHFALALQHRTIIHQHHTAPSSSPQKSSTTHQAHTQQHVALLLACLLQEARAVGEDALPKVLHVSTGIDDCIQDQLGLWALLTSTQCEEVRSSFHAQCIHHSAFTKPRIMHPSQCIHHSASPYSAHRTLGCTNSARRGWDPCLRAGGAFWKPL